jgi:hypothetical protein
MRFGAGFGRPYNGAEIPGPQPPAQPAQGQVQVKWRTKNAQRHDNLWVTVDPLNTK